MLLQECETLFGRKDAYLKRVAEYDSKAGEIKEMSNDDLKQMVQEDQKNIEQRRMEIE